LYVASVIAQLPTTEANDNVHVLVLLLDFLHDENTMAANKMKRNKGLIKAINDQ
jgi:hypothetical protein